MNVYLFIGYFKSAEESRLYAEEIWEPEPDDSVSDEEFEICEDKNPTWKMSEDLDLTLDSDFVEIIHDKDKFEYLKTAVDAVEHTKLLEFKSDVDSP